jgi:hypothetical protein
MKGALSLSVCVSRSAGAEPVAQNDNAPASIRSGVHAPASGSHQKRKKRVNLWLFLAQMNGKIAGPDEILANRVFPYD